MTTPPELRPCPMCGNRPVIDDETGSVGCTCGDASSFDVQDWNNAYCWKRIDELEGELEQARKTIERQGWNLGGCSTFALGYNLKDGYSKEMALPALHDVYKLAQKSSDQEKRIGELEQFKIQSMDAFDKLRDRYEAQLKELEQREKMLVESLEKYASHASNCAGLIDPRVEACYCGFSKVLSAVRGEKKEEK